MWLYNVEDGIEGDIKKYKTLKNRSQFLESLVFKNLSLTLLDIPRLLVSELLRPSKLWQPVKKKKIQHFVLN